MPQKAGWLTSLFHLRSVSQDQAITDAAIIKIELVHLHVLAEADQEPGPGVGVCPKHDLDNVTTVAPVAAQQLPVGQERVLLVHGDTPVRVARRQELPILAEHDRPDAALAVAEGDGPGRLHGLLLQQPDFAPLGAQSH